MFATAIATTSQPQQETFPKTVAEQSACGQAETMISLYTCNAEPESFTSTVLLPAAMCKKDWPRLSQLAMSLGVILEAEDVCFICQH